MADPILVVQVSENNKKAIFYEENTTYSLIDCLIHTSYRCFDQHPLVYCPKHTRISIYPYRTNHLTTTTSTTYRTDGNNRSGPGRRRMMGTNGSAPTSAGTQVIPSQIPSQIPLTHLYIYIYDTGHDKYAQWYVQRYYHAAWGQRWCE